MEKSGRNAFRLRFSVSCHISLVLAFGALSCGSRAMLDLSAIPGDGVGDRRDGSADASVTADVTMHPPDREMPPDSRSDSSVVGDASYEVRYDAPTDASYEVRYDAASDDGAARCDAGLMECEGHCVDPQSDSDNCGACGIKCDRFIAQGATLGACSRGMCTPIFAGCFEVNAPTFTCSEVCAKQGADCVAGGCLGATHAEYPFLSDCESNLNFYIHRFEACDTPTQFGSGERAGRCCCVKRAPGAL